MNQSAFLLSRYCREPINIIVHNAEDGEGEEEETRTVFLLPRV